MREFLGLLSHHTETNEKDINYQKFTLKRAKRHKPNQSFTQRSDLYEQKKKIIAFGSSTERVKDELKLPPLATYQVSYQQIDANIPKVRIHTERNQPSTKLSTETTLKSVNTTCKITRQRANSMQKQPQNSLQPIQLRIPNDYLPLRHYQPLSLAELSCMFDNLLVKHKITKPSQPQY